MINGLSDVQVLDKGDPFHVSMCRGMDFCSNQARQDFCDANQRVIDSWKAEGRKLLNDQVEQYKDRAGGFYLFVTRNRPLIYFAPRGQGAYLCKWYQDGRII